MQQPNGSNGTVTQNTRNGVIVETKSIINSVKITSNGSISHVRRRSTSDIVILIPQLPLPESIYIQIFSLLSIKDVYHLSLVSKSWYRILTSDRLWNKLYFHRWRSVIGVTASPERGFNKPGFWKKEYKIAKNWHTYNYRTNVLKGHTHAITCVQLLEDKRHVISGSEDSTQRIWELHTGKCCGVIKSTTTTGVSCLQWKGKQWVSGYKDGSLSLWSSDCKLISTITSPRIDYSVLCLQIDDTKIVTGGSDGQIRIWDPREPTHVGNSRSKSSLIQTQTSAVRCLQFDDTKICIGTETGKIKMFDWRTKQCFLTCTEHKRYTSTLQFDNDKIISGSPDWSIKIWDVKTGECREELEEHMKGVWKLKFDANKVVSAGGDRTVKIWDIEDDYWCVNTLRGHTGAVICLDFNNYTLVTGSMDNTVRVWDFSDPNLKKNKPEVVVEEGCWNQ